jgi:nitroimidazol reductase NimA-like FMN-containing flavoprotein (pyridoxamine 5'-phosphate oxidase superfamily)
MSVDKQEIEKYLNDTKLLVLATVNGSNAAALRVLGAFGVDGYTFYFSTKASSSKVNHITHNPKVTGLFQHENQEGSKFINVSIQGNSIQLSSKTDIDKAVDVIAARSPKFKERVEKNGLENNLVYRVDPKEVKILDRRIGNGPESISVLTF